jgi:hypothetical protein
LGGIILLFKERGRTMIKKILLIASFKTLSPGSTYLEALRKTGYDPLCFDMNKENARVCSHTKNPLILNLVSPYANKILNSKLITLFDKYKPDLVLVQKGLSVDTETLEEMNVKTKGKLLMFDRDFKDFLRILSQIVMARELNLELF